MFTLSVCTSASTGSPLSPPGPPGEPLPVRSVSFRPRRLPARSHGLCSRQRTSSVERSPKIAPGVCEPSLSPLACVTGCTPGLLVSTAPESDDAETKRPGYREAYAIAPLPPIERPAVARPDRLPTVG